LGGAITVHGEELTVVEKAKEEIVSPDFLNPKPGRGFGVRRLNRVPVFIVLGLVSIVAAVVGYTMYQRRPPQGSEMSATKQSDATPSAGEAQMLKTAPDRGVIGAAVPPGLDAGQPPPAADLAPRSTTPVPGVPAEINESPLSGSNVRDAEAEQWRRRIHQLALARLDEGVQALKSDTEIDTKKASEPKGSDSPMSSLSASSREAITRVSREVNEANSLAAATGSLPTAGGARPAAGSGYAQANAQNAKRDFLNQVPIPDDYLKYGRADAISPYEVKAGTVIPANMVSGINSDLPGLLLAQVSENIYDSATGSFLLIPQGAKLIGTYDNGVTFGQSRILVGWQRIIYPDGSSLDLGRMPGADESGYAGLKDKVDNHLVRLFSQALLLSIFSAGVQLGQPQSASGNNINSSQIVAAAIAQQMGELGTEIVRRNMDIAPTLEVRPGLSFNVMVTKDMVVRPWRDTRLASSHTRESAP
jgi:type IV secretion system protein VirB10